MGNERVCEGRIGTARGIVSALTFSPDGRTLVSTSEDGTALLFDVEDFGKPRAIAHEGGLSGAAFSRDGILIVTGSEDGDIHVYECGICESDDILMATAQRRLTILPPSREARRP